MHGILATFFEFFARLQAVMFKEFIEMRRDRATIGLIIAIPLMQLVMFGYAINVNPRHMPVAIVNDDHDVFSRRILSAMSASSYFSFVNEGVNESTAQDLLRRGMVQFVLYFPTQFSHDLLRGLHPQLLLEADATDPAATARNLAVFNDLAAFALKKELKGNLKHLQPTPLPYTPIVHAMYNPLAITAYNIVPGLLGVVLTMTMVVVTALAITREYERGTMENLLATPANPLEVMLGKIMPYIIVGYAQVCIILVLAKVLFNVPMEGSIVLLLILCLPFIAANLAMGLTFSTLASTQLQAVQSAMFFFLPSLLLSGFMFPFRGMPYWAQWVGSLLPLSHFLVIVRGILLKGNEFGMIWQEIPPIVGFFIVVMGVGLFRYRRTLD